jgi:hypothetical protein
MLPPLCTLPVSSTSAPPFTRSPVVPGYPVRGSPSADASGDFARGDFDFDRRRVIARSSSVPSPSVPPPRPSTPCVASSPSSSAPGNSSSRGVKKSDSLSNAVDASLSAVDGNRRSRAIGFHASGHPSDIGDTRHASMTLGMAVPAAVARACPSPSFRAWDPGVARRWTRDHRARDERHGDLVCHAASGMGAGSTRSLVEEPGAGEGPFTALGFAAASLAVSPAAWSGRGVRRVSARVVRRDEGRGSPSAISLAASIDPGWIVGLHLGGGFIFVFSDDGSAVAGHRRRPSRGLALRVHRHLRVPIARAAAADVVGEGRLAGRVALAGDPLEVLLAEPPSRGTAVSTARRRAGAGRATRRRAPRAAPAPRACRGRWNPTRRRREVRCPPRFCRPGSRRRCHPSIRREWWRRPARFLRRCRPFRRAIPRRPRPSARPTSLSWMPGVSARRAPLAPPSMPERTSSEGQMLGSNLECYFLGG